MDCLRHLYQCQIICVRSRCYILIVCERWCICPFEGIISVQIIVLINAPPYGLSSCVSSARSVSFSNFCNSSSYRWMPTSVSRIYIAIDNVYFNQLIYCYFKISGSCLRARFPRNKLSSFFVAISYWIVHRMHRSTRYMIQNVDQICHKSDVASVSSLVIKSHEQSGGNSQSIITLINIGGEYDSLPSSRIYHIMGVSLVRLNRFPDCIFKISPPMWLRVFFIDVNMQFLFVSFVEMCDGAIDGCFFFVRIVVEAKSLINRIA